ncbi:MAG: GGDEF domain-containing protein [Desulfomonilia bacterium]|jgi:diguanylate cyclase (GGDEF)-like protein
MLHIIPHEDPSQALRIKRFLMAFGSYFMWMLIVLYCYMQGLFGMTLPQTLLICGMVSAMNIIIFFIIRTGLNKHFTDPSLTETQMVLATVWVMIISYFLTQTRGIMLLLYMVIFIFGIFRLNLRQFCSLSVFAVLGYGFVIALLRANHPENINTRVELLYMVTLGAGLLWLSFMGSYISILRKKLSIANSELSDAMHLIKQQAIHDDLTGVYNRGYLFQILSREKSLADRGECPFSVCIFDLDDFKKVNDTYGHFYGDAVLKTLTERTRENIRQQDYIARYGGEEFVLVLAYSDLGDAVKCAERIRKMISEISFPGLPEDLRVTISMGLTRYQPGETIDALLVRADDALYRAKRSGKNTIICDPSVFHNITDHQSSAA